jgi:hypothetical protein
MLTTDARIAYSASEILGEVLSTKDVFEHFKGKKSLRWIYDHAEELGGKKIGGSWIFTEEGLRDALQGKRQVESQSVLPGQAAHQAVQNQERGSGLGKQKAKGIGEKSIPEKYDIFA